jgi:hypothetical protein
MKLLSYIISILLVVSACEKQKTSNITQQNIQKDTLKTQEIAIKSLSFDSLMTKFRYKNLKEFDLGKDTCRSSYFIDCENIIYKLTYQDAVTLQICKLYDALYEDKQMYKNYKCTKDGYPNNICYSTQKLKNEVIGITVLQGGDGWFTMFYLTYKNEKLISYTKYPFAISGSDIGISDHCTTKTINDSTFYTIDKQTQRNTLIRHTETKTTIDKNGIIKQDRKVFIDDPKY